MKPSDSLVQTVPATFSMIATAGRNQLIGSSQGGIGRINWNPTQPLDFLIRGAGLVSALKSQDPEAKPDIGSRPMISSRIIEGKLRSNGRNE